MKSTVDQLKQKLESALAAGTVACEADAVKKYQVDGKEPALAVKPQSAAEIAAALRLCSEAEATVIPWGGGTAIAIGNPPRRADVVMELTAFNRVVEHDAANLTVSVQGGAALNAVQSALEGQKQFAPFDPPFADRATVGAIVAANLNGPRRSSCGSVRDLVIGLKVTLANGEEIKAGGKVVKNVAGYDLCKLFVGSLGTLRGESFDVVKPRSDAGFYAAAGGRIGLDLTMSGPWYVRPQLDLLATLARAELQIDGTTRWAAPGFSALVGAGVGMRFP